MNNIHYTIAIVIVYNLSIRLVWVNLNHDLEVSDTKQRSNNLNNLLERNSLINDCTTGPKPSVQN